MQLRCCLLYFLLISVAWSLNLLEHVIIFCTSVAGNHIYCLVAIMAVSSVCVITELCCCLSSYIYWLVDMIIPMLCYVSLLLWDIVAVFGHSVCIINCGGELGPAGISEVMI